MSPTLTPGKFRGLTRMADASGRFTMLAVDQRPPIKAHVKAARGEDEARAEDVRAVKRALIETLAPHASSVLADPTHALMDAITLLGPDHGLIVTMEDSLFTETPGGRVSAEIPDWSVGKIRRIGGDAVKVLTWYRPDQDAASKQRQHDFSKRVGDACRAHDIPYLFELLVYPLADDAAQTTDYVEQPGKRTDHVLQSVQDFAADDYGVDVFKLESPVASADVPGRDGADWDAVQAQFVEMGRIANRPWVMLSAGAGKAQFRNVLEHAFTAGASGFLAGRAIWAEAFQAFPDLDAMKVGLRGEAAAYMADLNSLASTHARPWTTWFDPCRPVGFDTANLPQSYAEPGSQA